ncbi:putative transcriptional regulator of 2-aminoethylphosphonate degradation operons [bioreactor metagenome]|uniref:Putative transcriptional regulator of 2-aminoethylphosphonate degradation operons n=1 Tax=bioreactor metagenome TaxID=1076179 RepID=A0A644WLW6_9ZZZZ
MSEQTQMQSVRSWLLREMKEGAYRHAGKLPPEEVLADRLSISRTQLRDSLSQLEREGFISRHPGAGTVINRHVVSVKVRMDMEIEFMEMIAQSGREPSLLSASYETIPASETIAERLSIYPGDMVLRAVRLIGADGKPAIYCEDYIPASLIKNKQYTGEDLQKPIFSFLKEFCSLEAHMDLTEVCPAVADAALAGIFCVPEGTPLLYLDELDYDREGMPIFYSPQYYIGGVIRHTLLRMKF